MLTPEQRTLRARTAAYALHAQRDPRETTRAATEASQRRFLDQVDPDRVLPEPERQRRAVSARRAYMTGLALKSSKARAKAALERAQTERTVARTETRTSPLPGGRRLVRRSNPALRAS